jgi:15-cis-phytoene synthase
MTEHLTLKPNNPLIEPLVPQGVRARLAVLWDVHERLSSLSMTGREPALRQIRLVWWRDALGGLGQGDSAPAEPLLGRVTADLLPVPGGAALAELAEARLAMLDSDWAVEETSAYGALLFRQSASLLGEDGVGGGCWSLLEVALALETQPLRDNLLAAAAAMPAAATGPKVLRVLDRLARSIARRGGGRARGREQLLILRVGLLGR